MRFVVKARMPLHETNRAIKDGSLGKKIQSILAELKPEAAYFMEEGGHRTAILVVDIQEPSQIPSIAEPFFLGLNAEVSFHAAMTPEDLGKAGLDKLAQKWAYASALARVGIESEIEGCGGPC